MITEFAILIIVVLLIGFMFKFLKKIMILVINSFIGLLALFGFNAVFNENIAINVYSVLIAGIGGAIGFIIIVVLHFLGLAF